MHDTAFRIGTLAMQTYADLKTASILEIGAQIVNGSLRTSALPTTEYVGIDIEEGDGVDIVSAPGAEWPVDDARFDLVMATSVFEHDTAFWRTFVQMCRKAKPGGHIYISAPSNGKVHRYPQDFWRFYPDAGLALEALAESEGVPVKLVESFVAERDQDEWNDFCAIFRREPSSAPLPTKFLYEKVACTNALTWQSPDVRNGREGTEDQVLLWRERDQVVELERQRQIERAAWEAERDALARGAAEARIAREEAELLLKEARANGKPLKGEVERLAEVDRELKVRENRIADLESNLRQRQEEISQAWAEAEAERDAKDRLAATIQEQQDRIEALDGKLDEADAWVFKLSAERRAAEEASARLESELSRERELRSSDRSRADVLLREVEDLGKARQFDEVRLEKGHRQLAMMLDQLREREVELAAHKADMEAMAAKLVAAGDDLERLKNETSTLNRALREKDLLARQKERNLDWLRQVDEVIAASTKGWRGLMPPAWRRQRQLDMLRARGLFDAASYLERYPDVGEAGIDPLLHYILHGMIEGRQADINLG
jgi:SAM-dependent methyltransferase